MRIVMDNPYTPPNTEVTGLHPKSPSALWRWVCGVYLVYGGISGGITMIFWEQIAALAAAAGTVVPSVGDAVRAIGIVNGIASLAGGVLLIIKRRWAFHLTVTIFVLGIINTAITVVTGGFAQLGTGAAIAGLVLGWAIIIVILIYTRNLMRRGVLR
jgi:hypothetical protein